MVKCSNCGAWNNDNNNFCSNCANDLRMDNKTKTSYSKSQIKCPNCGTMNTNARFCGACGKAIWKYNTTKPSDQQIKKSLGRQLTALVLFIIFVCFLVKGFLDFYVLVFYQSPYFYNNYDYEFFMSLGYMGLGLYGLYIIIKNK